MTQRLSIATLLLILLSAFAPTDTHKAAYKIYTHDGHLSSYQALLQAAQQTDVVFFGELHNNPIAHWLQLALTKDLWHSKDSLLSLGAEMFEADNQLLIDEYLQGQVKEKNFEREMRLWPNYKTDYKPLMRFAKAKGLPFVATNVPRRYAAMVHHQGSESLATLSAAAKGFLPPLPFAYDSTLSCYADMMQMMRRMKHANANLPKAQALKDATMAWFIQQNLQTDGLFIHYNGAYHSQNKEGIVWYLTQAMPQIKTLTIHCCEQTQLDSLQNENAGLADFIIVVDADMTKTH